MRVGMRAILLYGKTGERRKLRMGVLAKILRFFLVFLHYQHFRRIYIAIRLRVSVSDADIDNAVGAVGPEAAHQQIFPLAIIRLSG